MEDYYVVCTFSKTGQLVKKSDRYTFKDAVTIAEQEKDRVSEEPYYVEVIWSR